MRCVILLCWILLFFLFRRGGRRVVEMFRAGTSEKVDVWDDGKGASIRTSLTRCILAQTRAFL